MTSEEIIINININITPIFQIIILVTILAGPINLN